jgi:hypothetical protein
MSSTFSEATYRASTSACNTHMIAITYAMSALGDRNVSRRQRPA